ncbi:hypothetical protein Y1Q_0012976 [Alligator mississippiensis]|uniref:Beta-defensin-like domain-containing protein n=3 Tax=Alligator TaxID=8495 RepID=A0A151NVT7_ALLMI|nr:hypothetical protein Y1Q_0012976 [Alligator mississippiensis]
MQSNGCEVGTVCHSSERSWAGSSRDSEVTADLQLGDSPSLPIGLKLPLRGFCCKHQSYSVISVELEMMKFFYLLLVVLFGIFLATTANGQRASRYVNHCLQKGGTCRYDDCEAGEEQIGTCYRQTMVCCRDEE